MAEKTNFVDTIHCMSKAHCNTCRNKEGGRPWRKGLTSLFVLPDDKVDFECPYGKDWGDSQGPQIQHDFNAQTANAPKQQSAPSNTGCGRCSRAAASRKKKQ